MTDEASVDSGSQEQVAESVQPDWRAGLDEDLRSNPSLTDFKDVNSLAKSFVNAQSMIGSSIKIPSQDAGEEQLNNFYSKLESVPNVARLDGDLNDLYTKLGRPESHDQYTIDYGEYEDKINKDKVGTYAEVAHEVGLTNDQFSKLVAKQVELEASEFQANQQKMEAYQEQLRKNWGESYDQRLHAAKHMAEAYSEKYPEAMQDLLNSNAANNPAVIEMFAEAYKHTQEGQTVAPNKSAVQFGTSAEEALDKITEIRNNPKHPANNPSDPAHKREHDKLSQLFKIAYPS